MLQFLFNNWLVIFLILMGIVVLGYTIFTFLTMPTNSQLLKVKEWLLYAVTKAEKELGGGTGQIKLRYVYDMFILKFPYLAKKISFEAFSFLVDEVLTKFKDLIDNNLYIKNYVQGE